MFDYDTAMADPECHIFVNVHIPMMKIILKIWKPKITCCWAHFTAEWQSQEVNDCGSCIVLSAGGNITSLMCLQCDLFLM